MMCFSEVSYYDLQLLLHNEVKKFMTFTLVLDQRKLVQGTGA